LCDRARFTGYQFDGGYAKYTVADQRFCFPVPACYSDAEAAPLMCAGLIGYRSLIMAGDANRPGIYGFGAAAPPKKEPPSPLRSSVTEAWQKHNQ
jgi:alcohol dehydrogenase, propanol-preferring